jgi:hypothetical protein
MRSSALSPAGHEQDSQIEMMLTLLHSAWEFPGPIRMGDSIVNHTLRFTIGEDPVDGPDIYEMLDSGQLFSLGGSGVGQANGSVVDGTLHGELCLYPAYDCVSDHRFHMER